MAPAFSVSAGKSFLYPPRHIVLSLAQSGSPVNVRKTELVHTPTSDKCVCPVINHPHSNVLLGPDKTNCPCASCIKLKGQLRKKRSNESLGSFIKLKGSFDEIC